MMELSEPATLDEPAPPTQPFSVPLRTKDASAPSHDDEEWEYEYSKTDAEIFYVTIDLTTTNTKEVRRGAPRSNKRSGYKVKWVTPAVGKKETQKLAQPPTISPRKTGAVVKDRPRSTIANDDDDENQEDDSGNGENQDGEVSEPEEQEDEKKHDEEQQFNAMSRTSEEVINQMGSNQKFSGTENSNRMEDLPKIQILDLHSDNPIISFKNSSFSCSWAENVGTELLFTNRNTSNPLPALRSLNSGVDLLAASSVRLMSTPVSLVAKDHSYEPNSHERSVPRRANFVVPVGQGSGVMRRKQANFLERMQDLKVKKNESDEVTVFAIKRQTNKDWYNEIKNRWDDERAELEKKRSEGGLLRQEVLLKLEEINNMEKALEEQPEHLRAGWRSARGKRRFYDAEDSPAGPAKRARGGQPRGKKRFRGRRARGNRVSGGGTILTVSESSEPEGPRSAISTPTPRTWDDWERE